MQLRITSFAFLLFCNLFFQSSFVNALSLEQAIASKHRSKDAQARDIYRHPIQTLRFFELKPDMSVVEIWPGSGWYSEIIAPYMKEHGVYYAAGFSLKAKRTPQWRKDMAQELIEKFKKNPDIYGNAIITALSVPDDINMAPKCSADRVLTFRNTHNWIRGDYAQEMFDAIYTTLKQDGILGLVQHRAQEGTTIEDVKKSGYVPESLIIEMAKKAGLILIEKSEINANPKDSKNHPKGVWTLPPTLRLGETDKEKYLTIGESDRMTLKFKKSGSCQTKATL